MENYFSKLEKVLIISEIGVNHNGELGLAKKMIEASKAAGADAVKFQTFSAELLALHRTPKVPYQIDVSNPHETHYEMLKRLELSAEDHYELFNFCKLVGVEFISTPYDIESAIFLAKLGVKIFKTASADLIDLPLHQFLASLGSPVIVSTGMANLAEVEAAMEIYWEAKNPNVALLHSVSNYPCSDESLNLRAMSTLSSAFSLPVGLSDHSRDFLAAALSVALGGKIIEKHFTLDKMMTGPDHKASSSPKEFALLVDIVRRSEMMLGSERKFCQKEEREMSRVSRKSIVLSRAKAKGDVLYMEDLCLMRPGNGLAPRFLSTIEGMEVRDNLSAGHQLRWKDIIAK